MKLKSISLLALTFAVLALASCNKDETNDSANKTETNNLEKRNDLMSNGSYALAYDIVNNMIGTGYRIDREYFLKGIADALDKKAGLLTPEERMKFTQAYTDSMQSNEKAKVERQLETTRELEAKLPPLQKGFFERNKKKQNIIETPSGIQVETVKAGNGKAVEPDDLYEVNLKAYYVDGTVFENSKDKYQGNTAKVPAQGVLPGWKEAMTYAKEGGIYRFYFPPEQAFGKDGVFPTIPPDVIVIFEVELVKFAGKFDPNRMQMPQRPQVQGAPQQGKPIPTPGPLPFQGMPGKR